MIHSYILYFFFCSLPFYVHVDVKKISGNENLSRKNGQEEFPTLKLHFFTPFKSYDFLKFIKKN